MIRVPENVRFEIDDVESDWLYKSNSFDYIHSRYMIGAIEDWKAMIRRAYKYVPRSIQVVSVGFT